MRRPPRLKKFRSRVRPGVLEVRARVLRPVNAFSRLDLPTLDRPAKATSVPPPSCGRSFSSAAETRKSQGPAKRSRPASRAASSSPGVAWPTGSAPSGGGLRRTAADRPSVALPDEGLLGHRQDVIPRPGDYQSGREGRTQEEEDKKT